MLLVFLFVTVVTFPCNNKLVTGLTIVAISYFIDTYIVMYLVTDGING